MERVGIQEVQIQFQNRLTRRPSAPSSTRRFEALTVQRDGIDTHMDNDPPRLFGSWQTERVVALKISR